jgi:hypothetical protein
MCTLNNFAHEDRLSAIGIEPKFTRDFVFADGKKERRLFGEGSFSTEGFDETITCLIVFDPPGSLYAQRVNCIFYSKPRNASTVRPASRIRARNVPFASSRWSGTVRRRYGCVRWRRMMWLPV